MTRPSYDSAADPFAALLGAAFPAPTEQEVAQFVLEGRHIVTLDGVGDLVGFFDGVGRDGPERLFDIPWAARFGIAQPCHDLEQARDAGADFVPVGHGGTR